MNDRELNRIKFKCDDGSKPTAETLHEYSEVAAKLKVDRHGRLVVTDPQWLDRVDSLTMLLTDEAARNRLRILSNKTQRAYSGDYTISHSVTTASSVLSLLLGISIKATISQPDFLAIKEIGELVSIADLRKKEQTDSLRGGNVTFVEAV